jgi:RimJ/RimL family protein N-acetyltransferase
MVDHSLTDGVLLLKPLAGDDAAEWLAGEDDEQLRWFEAPRPSRLQDVERFISACRESWRTLGSHRHWGIRRVDSPELRGGVDLRALEDDKVNLSYLVFPQFRRQGLARRASVPALTYAGTSMGAKEALIKMLPENVSSRKLALELGARYQGQEPSDAGAIFQIFEVDLPLGYTAKGPRD